MSMWHDRIRNRLRVALVGICALVAWALPGMSQDQPRATDSGPRLSGAEWRVLAQLSDARYRVRQAAIQQLRRLPMERAEVVVAAGLEAPQWRIQQACAQEAGRRPLKSRAIAERMLSLLVDEADAPTSQAWPGLREAFLRIGGTAVEAYSVAQRLGQFAQVPRLMELGEELLRRRVWFALDEVPKPREGFFWLPYAGQFRALCVADWMDTARNWLVASLPRIKDQVSLTPAGADFQPGARTLFQRMAWVLCAVAEWGRGDTRRQSTALQTAQETLAACGPLEVGRARLDHEWDALRLLATLATAVLGDSRELGKWREGLARRERDLATTGATPDLLFAVRCFQAFAAQWLGETESAITHWRLALDETLLPVRRGIQRSVLAELLVLYARALATTPATATRAMAVLERAADEGYDDAPWLSAVASAEFGALRDSESFKRVLAAISAQRK